MTIDEAKKILPPELKYPLPDGVIDNLMEIQKLGQEAKKDLSICV